MTCKRAALCLSLLAALASPVIHAQEADAPQESWIPGSGTTPDAPLIAPHLTQQHGFPGQVEAHAHALIQKSQLVSGPAPTRNLRLGDSGSDVLWLLNALAAHGYQVASPAPAANSYPPAAANWPVEQAATDQALADQVNVALGDTVFDEGLDASVRAFQADHGLADDGIAGPAVYRQLTQDNRAVGHAALAWSANLYRWSNEARAAGHDRLIVVNIPSFTLHAIDLSTNEEMLQSRVIVGKAGTRTPLMMTRMVNLKANPDWSPPKSIRGARYQRPGPNNALGLMRFSLDNNMSIYLHDTNKRGLYENDMRALSAGCVRVQEWKALAAWSARQDETWVDEVALVGGKTRFLPVDTIPVILTYSRTDFVDGDIRQYGDVYGRGERAIGYAELNGAVGETWAWTQGR